MGVQKEALSIMHTLLSLSLALLCGLSTSTPVITSSIPITQASVYDGLLQGVEVKGYLFEEYSHGNSQYTHVLSQLEEAALKLCANAVMEFRFFRDRYEAWGTGVAVCDPGLGTPCC